MFQRNGRLAQNSEIGHSHRALDSLDRGWTGLHGSNSHAPPRPLSNMSVTSTQGVRRLSNTLILSVMGSDFTALSSC